MVRRAEHVDDTRRRIVEAAVRLHTTVGPAATSVAAIADEAGVTRLTVYRHFPEIGPLFTACRRHWIDTHPAPDAAGWLAIDDLRQRARIAFGQLYAFYRSNAEELSPIYRDRDLPSVPQSSRDEMAAQDEAIAAALLAGFTPPDARLRAAARHLVGFVTWSSLVRDAGLDDETGAELAASMLDAATQA